MFESYRLEAGNNRIVNHKCVRTLPMTVSNGLENYQKIILTPKASH